MESEPQGTRTDRFLLLATEIVDGERRGPGQTITETVFFAEFEGLHFLELNEHTDALHEVGACLSESYDTLGGQRSALQLAGRLGVEYLITTTTHITSGDPPEGSKLQPRMTALGVKILDPATGRLLFAHGDRKAINIEETGKADPATVTAAVKESLTRAIKSLKPRILDYLERHPISSGILHRQDRP